MFHNFIVLSIYTTIMSGNLKRKRCAYDTNFKLKVIQYSDECKNNRETSRKFNVSEKLVRDWKKAALDLEDLPRSKKARRGGKPSFPQEEKLIKEWVCEHRQELDGTEDDILWQDDRDAPCADSDNEGEEMYDDMLTTEQMIQMLEEEDSDEEFLGFD